MLALDRFLSLQLRPAAVALFTFLIPFVVCVLGVVIQLMTSPGVLLIALAVTTSLLRVMITTSRAFDPAAIVAATVTIIGRHSAASSSKPKSHDPESEKSAHVLFLIRRAHCGHPIGMTQAH